LMRIHKKQFIKHMVSIYKIETEQIKIGIDE
jgi:hypothetical protein